MSPPALPDARTIEANDARNIMVFPADSPFISSFLRRGKALSVSRKTLIRGATLRDTLAPASDLGTEAIGRPATVRFGEGSTGVSPQEALIDLYQRPNGSRG